LVLIVGSRKADIPRSFDGALITATSSCIAIGCRAEDDGPTRLGLGSTDEESLKVEPAFVAQLETPDGVVAIETVFGARLAECPVHGSAAKILVWVNNDIEPDEILIAVEG